MRSTLDINKPYIFSARIRGQQILKLNAFLYKDQATHTNFMNSILSILDWRCRNGGDELIKDFFGTEFYVKFIEDYLDNLCKIETVVASKDKE